MMGEAQMWRPIPKTKNMGPNWTTTSSEDHYFLVMTNDPTIGLLPYTQHLLTLKGRSMIFFGFGLALSFHPESY
jgi:hypothetical protein